MAYLAGEFNGWTKIVRRRFLQSATPVRNAMEMISRITKYSAIEYPECKMLLFDVCKRYSGNPHSTWKSVCGLFDGYGDCYIINGKVAQADLIDDIRFHNQIMGEHRYKILQMVSESNRKLRSGKRKCDICCKWDVRRNVSDRSDVYRWDLDKNDFRKSKSILCTSCWNKVKPIARAKREAAEIKYLQQKLYRGILKWQK